MIQAVNKRSISEIFKKNADFYYYIPKYQREYIWSYTQWNDLYDDIQDNEKGYFIGSIIYINTNDSINPKFEVVDGQQRLTTISLYLTAIYSLLKANEEQLDEDGREECSSLRKSLKNKYSENGMIIVPQIQNSNKDDYNMVMFENGLRDSCQKAPKYHQRRIYNCYRHFLQRLKRDMEQTTANQTEFLMSALDNIYHAMLVTIEVSSHSDAYMLFESLNHRGTPLTAIDLMKNMIMARAEKAGMDAGTAFEQWTQLLQFMPDDYRTQERFFRHYYDAFKDSLNEPFRKSDSKKKDVLGTTATKSNIVSIYERLINYNLKNFLADIIRCGEIYGHFLNNNKEEGRSVFSKELIDLLHVQAASAYILLLYIFRNMTLLNISDSDMLATIKLLVVFFLRRNVTDYPSTRELTRIFMTMTHEIRERGITGHDVFIYIKDMLCSSCASDELFRKGLEGDMYKSNVDATRYILCALAEKRMTKETWTDLWQRYGSNTFIWTIEHIFPEGDNIPQCWVDMIAGGDTDKAKEYQHTYAHKLGNLTLTGYNTELSNYSFTEKRDRKSRWTEKYVGYRNGLEINNELAEKDSWTIDDIEKRTRCMIDEILDMFKMQ